MTRLILYGTGQMASVMYEYLTRDSPHDVVAFTVDGSLLIETRLLGLPVVAFEDVADRYPPDDFEMMITVGYQRVNRLRAERFGQAREMGYRMPSYVSSRAAVWPDLVMGENCVILEGNIIQPYVRVGDNVMIGPGACVGHHNVIMDHCFLASHVDVSGDVTIEPYSFLGANCTIRDGVTVARDNVIGANVVVLRSTDPGQVYLSPRPQLMPISSDKLPRI